MSSSARHSPGLKNYVEKNEIAEALTLQVCLESLIAISKVVSPITGSFSDRDTCMKKKTLQTLLKTQHTEITEYHIYTKLSRFEKNASNRTILEKIASEELKHFRVWEKYTGAKVNPSAFKIWIYYMISVLLGVTFGIKLMKRNEKKAVKIYQKIPREIPEAAVIEAEECEHEKNLIGLISEERLDYVGSIVLGLNDAIVELTGALAGLSLALQNAKMVALTGMITGISASLSMAASEYLSTKSENNGKSPLKASVYTGIAYIVTVIVLILPFIFIAQPLTALALTLTIALLVITFFTFYVSVATDISFSKRFFEMAGISLGVASITFIIGYLIRTFWNIEI